MKSIIFNCEYCGKEKSVYLSYYKKSKNHFCSRECNLKNMNALLNPTRMTEATKSKIALSHMGTGGQKTYTKNKGVHTHRIVAEKMLGRKLSKGEIVHHMDGNKRNNDPINLKVFISQAEHAKWHIENDEKYYKFKKVGGDAL